MREGLERALEHLVNLIRSLIEGAMRVLPRTWKPLAFVAVLWTLAYGAQAAWQSVPVVTLEPGEMAIRQNLLTDAVEEVRQGAVMVVPRIHALRRFSMRDRLVRIGGEGAPGMIAPFQSGEGVAIGVDVEAHYALDPDKVAAIAARLPDDVEADVAAPAVREVLRKVFAHYSVKEIFATQRTKVQAEIDAELGPRLAREGLILRGTQLGAVELLVAGTDGFKRYSLRDQIYRPHESSSATGQAPFQTIEGLSLGVDLGVRYALDLEQLAAVAQRLPDDIGAGLVQPAVHGVMYKVFARYTIKEIFSSKRAEIQEAIEKELKPYLARDGIVLRSVQVGNVDLPNDYRHGMERMLQEELATEKMKHTLVLKEQMAQEQVIQAKAQEEAMKHILPLKQKQIQQRKLEADADKQYRIRQAQANAEARRIEAAGEADSRRKLADAESYRLENVGRLTSEQLARDGATVQKYPLLVQKTMADKLSDKVSVIIAAPPANGSFIGSTLLGQGAVPVGRGGED